MTETKISFDDKKIPIPPTKQGYYLPEGFLIDLLRTLDYKVEILCETVGYGFVTIRIAIYRGKVANVHYNDEISMKTLVDTYFPENKQEVDKI